MLVCIHWFTRAAQAIIGQRGSNDTKFTLSASDVTARNQLAYTGNWIGRKTYLYEDTWINGFALVVILIYFSIVLQLIPVIFGRRCEDRPNSSSELISPHIFLINQSINQNKM